MLPLGASDLMSAILQRADTFIIATFAGFDALAVYSAAEFFTRIIANPRYLFDHIVAPVIAEALHLKDRARVRYNLALVTRWVITASAPIAVTVIVLRAEILGLYGGAFVAGNERAGHSRARPLRDRLPGPDAVRAGDGRALAPDAGEHAWPPRS